MANVKTTKQDIKKYLEGETIPSKYEGKFDSEIDYVRFLLSESIKVIADGEEALAEKEEALDIREKEIEAKDVKSNMRNAISTYIRILKATAPNYSRIDCNQLRKCINEAGQQVDYHLGLK